MPLRWPRSQSPSTEVTSLISALLPSEDALTLGSVRRTHSLAQGEQFLFCRQSSVAKRRGRRMDATRHDENDEGGCS